jgi:hypothetical protein
MTQSEDVGHERYVTIPTHAGRSWTNQLWPPSTVVRSSARPVCPGVDPAVAPTIAPTSQVVAPGQAKFDDNHVCWGSGSLIQVVPASVDR